jgi:hypothetical protein
MADSPNFTDAERAALALTEAATRLAGRPDPVPGEVWNEAGRRLHGTAVPSAGRSPEAG